MVFDNGTAYRGNSDQLVGMFYIIDGSLHSIEDNTDITIDMIEGSIEYFLRNGKLLASVYKKNNGNFDATVIEDFEAKSITSNDIYKLSNEYLSISEPIIVTVLTNIDFVPSNNDVGLLHYATKKYPEGNCPTPCQDSYGYCNVITQACSGIKIDICTLEENKSLLESNNILYDFPILLNDARDFRDFYLNKSKGGIILIKLYYDISNTIFQNIDLQFAIETFDLLQAFRAKMNSLRNNPSGNQILLTNQEIDAIIQYLTDLKQYVNDNDLQPKIDKIVNLANDCRNKTNEEITQLIGQFRFD